MLHYLLKLLCTINSKIDITPKAIYLPILKLHSILAVENLLARNNKTIIYNVQVHSVRLKSSIAFEMGE